MYKSRSTSCAGHGLMLIVDAACLYELVARTERASQIEEFLEQDPDFAAPHIVDVEVLGIIRRDLMLGLLDPTAARQAVEDLRDWPGERHSHQELIGRAWQLRNNVRTWDAFYVALAEALQATLVTRDQRLGRVPGLRCKVEIVAV
jgi:predicted nucleic acid-binding protein